MPRRGRVEIWKKTTKNGAHFIRIVLKKLDNKIKSLVDKCNFVTYYLLGKL